MRRAMMVLLFLLAASVAPQSAQARPRVLGAILGVITNPIGSILGAARRGGRHAASHRRSYAGRAAPAAAAAGVAAGAAAASASGPATASTSEVTVPTVSTGAGNPDPSQSQTKASTGGPSDTTAGEPTEPAPIQRSAALATKDEPTPPPPSTASAARLGMVGPAVWPSAFEDVIGYALWPKDYAGRLRTHGIGDVLTTAFTPGAAFVARAQVGGKKDEPKTSGSGLAGGMCGDISAIAPDWPAADIERSLKLDDAQRVALNELKTSIATAAATIRAACRDEVAPVDRVRALQNSLWAVHDAAQTIRAPLAKFYDSLSDEQKKQFAAPAAAQTEAQATSRSDMVRMCGASDVREMPMQHVEQALRVSKPQRASLDSLQKKSFEMGQFLMASCLKPLAATPAERLDAATDRLTAVIFAASNVNMTLNDFTSQLDADQKTKLNAFGR